MKGNNVNLTEEQRKDLQRIIVLCHKILHQDNAAASLNSTEGDELGGSGGGPGEGPGPRP